MTEVNKDISVPQIREKM